MRIWSSIQDGVKQLWEIRRIGYSPLILVGLLVFCPSAMLAANLPIAAFSINQLYNSADNIYSGAAMFEYNNSAGLLGFINVVDSSNNWWVQNLPVGFIGTDVGLYSTIGYEMAVAPAPSSTPVTSGAYYVDFTLSPETSVSSIQANSTLQTYGIQPEDFNIGDTSADGDPAGRIVLSSPAPGTLTFNGNNDFNVSYQFGHPNVAAAENQCAPAAVANSLDWLRQTQGVNIPNANVPGNRTDNPNNSLVGVLESATYMGRRVASVTDGGGIWPLDGKMKYLAATGNGGLIVSFQNTGTGVAGGSYAAGTTIPFNDGNNYTATQGGMVAINRGAPSFSFIQSEIAKGEDVEINFADGHYVNVNGAGVLNGNAFITSISDYKQGPAALGNAFNNRTAQRPGTERIDFSWVSKTGALTVTGGYFNGSAINQVITESVPEPSALWFAGSALVLLSLRRLRSKR